MVDQLRLNLNKYEQLGGFGRQEMCIFLKKKKEKSVPEEGRIRRGAPKTPARKEAVTSLPWVLHFELRNSRSGRLGIVTSVCFFLGRLLAKGRAGGALNNTLAFMEMHQMFQEPGSPLLARWHPPA